MKIHAHDPRIFRQNASDVAYDPAAKCPAWEAFLAEVFEHDPGLVRTLQHWFGYILADGAITHQKIALLIGAARAGKGVISRILTELLGKASISSLSLQDLSHTFGLETSHSARLLLFPDVKWTGVNSKDVAITKLMQISGGDSVPVSRKFKKKVDVLFQARIMMLSNNLPKFEDDNGAMLNRFIPITFKKSFVGREDIGLEWRLRQELPGILRWAVEGLADLLKLGHIYQAPSCAQEREAVLRSTSPIRGFIEDYVEYSPEPVELDTRQLWAKFQLWQEETGNTRLNTNLDALSRLTISSLNLGVSDPDLHVRSVRHGSGDKRFRALVHAKLFTTAKEF